MTATRECAVWCRMFSHAADTVEIICSAVAERGYTLA
jgi:hypothetical protein